MLGAILGVIIVGLICATALVITYRPDIVASITGKPITDSGIKTCSGNCINGVFDKDCKCQCKPDWQGGMCDVLITKNSGGGGGIKTCSGNCVNGSFDGNCICICDPNWQGSDCNSHKTIINPNLVTKIIISKPGIKIGNISFYADGVLVIPSTFIEDYRAVYTFSNPVNLTKIIHISQPNNTTHAGNQIDLFNGTGARFGDSFIMTSDMEIGITYKYGLIIDKQFVKQPSGGGGLPPVCQSCQNGGLLNSADCSCKCPSNYTGQYCQTNTCASCLNGGTLNPATCACSCPANYNGARCENNTCQPCQNYGQLDPSTCACTCFDGWKGSLCNIAPNKDCSAVVCKNGTVDPNTCECKCSANWSGIDCGTRICSAIMKPCARGTVDTANCTCICPPNYSGVDCSISTCPLVCQNGGVLDRDNCKCTCPADYKGVNCSERDCIGKPCVHGTLDANCNCQCNPTWKGMDCNTLDCTGKSCLNGVLDGNCNCVCNTNWTGASCNLPDCSSKVCVNGTKDANCQCQCNPTWTGASCEIRDCSSTPCVNGIKDANCQCQCSKDWIGSTCEIRDCSLTRCVNGTKGADCSCTCNTGYSGATCENQDCSSAGCLNGSTPSSTCACQCINGYTGLKCETPPSIYPNTLLTYSIKAPGKSLYIKTPKGTGQANPQSLDSCAGFPASCKWNFKPVAKTADVYNIKASDGDWYIRSAGGNPTWLAGSTYITDPSAQYKVIKGDRPGSVYLRTVVDPTKYLMTQNDWTQGGSLDSRVCSPGSNTAGCQWELTQM